MNINATSSAQNLINSAHHKVADAAHKIATLPIKTDEVGSPDYKSDELIKPILSLHEAELENSAAVKILKTQNEMIGSLLDISA